MIFFYWVFLSSIVFIVGASLSKFLVITPSGSDICIPSGGGKCLGESAILVMFTVSIISLVSNVAHLILHCAVITETPLNEVFSILPLFLLKTKYGVISLIRTVLVVLIILVLSYALKKNNKWVLVTEILLSLFIVISLTMSGHQGTKGYLSAPFVLDVFHVVAITLWIGGLFFIRYCYSFLFKEPGMNYWDIFLNLINRFSLMATISVIVVVITGLALSVFNFESVSEVVSTQYGLVLITKSVLVAGLLLFGALNKFFIVPKLNKKEIHDLSKLTSLRNKLHVFITTEVILGLIIILITSFLTHLSPVTN